MELFLLGNGKAIAKLQDDDIIIIGNHSQGTTHNKSTKGSMKIQKKSIIKQETTKRYG